MGNRWTPEAAHRWFARQPWLVGCNFTPSNAINQLEMWQAGSFDLATIDRELELRSEEHTSELQSLMRISYAVFCLKKKKKNTTRQSARTSNTIISKSTQEKNITS